MSKVYTPSECKFAVGEVVKAKKRKMGGYERDVLYAEAGDTGVVVFVPRMGRPMAVEVKMDEPRIPYGILVFSEDDLEPA